MESVGGLWRLVIETFTFSISRESEHIQAFDNIAAFPHKDNRL